MDDQQLISIVRGLLAEKTPDAVAINTSGDPVEDARILDLLQGTFPRQSFSIVDPKTHLGGAAAKAAREASELQ